MAARELHLETLFGKPVLDSAGRSIGRLEEVRAEQSGDDWVVQDYLVGGAALLERLSAWDIGLALVRLLGARRAHSYTGYIVPWDKLDLADPERPRLRCAPDELETFDHRRET